MNARFLAVSLAVVSSFAVGSKADALVVTTPPVAFKAIGTPTSSTVPATLNFANFGSLYAGPGVLTKVRWKITTPATVGGQTRITNQSFTTGITPTASDMSYSLKLTPSILGGPLAGGSTTPTSLACVTSPSATTACTNLLPAGDEDAGINYTKTYNITGSYQSSSVFASLTPAQSAAFTSGSVTSAYSANFESASSNLAFGFNPNLSTTVTAKPYIEGMIALEYEYELPPTGKVPAPLPLVGAAAAFGWSRRLRSRIAVA